MTDILDEQQDYGATVVRYQYRPLTTQQAEDGVTATIVVASWREWVPGYNLPDSYEFEDGSVVLGTNVPPRTPKDVSEVMKDDKSNPKSLDGDYDNEWHKQLRIDIESAPDKSLYKNNKVYINPKWDLKQQLEAIKKGQVPKRMKRPKRGYRPDWVDKVYGKK